MKQSLVNNCESNCLFSYSVAADHIDEHLNSTCHLSNYVYQFTISVEAAKKYLEKLCYILEIITLQMLLIEGVLIQVI